MIQVRPVGLRGRAAFALALLVVPLVAASPGGNPIDAAIASPAEGAELRANETLTFVDGTSTSPECPIVEWEWKFGAGIKKHGRTVEHSYDASGDEHVHLHVLGSCGHRAVAHVRFVVVDQPAAPPEHVPEENGTAPPPATEDDATPLPPAGEPTPPPAQAPVASLAAPQRVVAGDVVALDGSGSTDPDGSALVYHFTLDGQALAADGSSATLVLTQAREHVATLTVTDSDGLASAPAEARIQVVPASMSVLTIQGPSVVPAGATVSFELLGEDGYGNEITLEQPTLEWKAPIRSGVTSVVHEVDGVRGSLAVEIAPAALELIVLDAPPNLVVGRAAEFVMRGEDAYGNAVELSAPTLVVTPTEAGPLTVCHEEAGVRGCVTVVVSEFLVSRIEILAPSRVNRGRSIQLSAVVYDDEGKVRAGVVEWSATQGGITPDGVLTTVEPTLVTARAGGKAASVQVEVTPTLTVLVRLPSPGEANVARVTVRFTDGTPVEDAAVTARIRHVLLLTDVIEKTVKARTGPDGIAWIALGDEWSVPGEHRIQASAIWKENGGLGTRQTRHPV